MIVLRCLARRIRLLFALAFICSTILFFYWIWCVGFENGRVIVIGGSKRQAKSKELSKKAPASITNYPATIRRYCNFPIYNGTHDPFINPSASSSNSPPANLRLRGLVIVTRHGDRAPLVPFPGHLSTPDCGLWRAQDVDIYHRYRKDIQHINYRDHRDPLLLDTFSPFPTNERCRPGHLTALGVVQLIQLGRQLRRRYRAAWRFPPNAQLETTPKHRCAHRTTAYPRTYQSALAFLYGWNTAEEGDYGTRKSDNFFESESSKITKNGNLSDESTCSTRNAIFLSASETTHFCTEPWCAACAVKLETYRRDYHDFRVKALIDEKTKTVAKILESVKKILQTPDLVDPHSAFDTLAGYACHRESMPCNTNTNNDHDNNMIKEKCAQIDWLVRLHDEAKRAFLSAVRSEPGRKLVALEAAPILSGLSRMAERIILGISGGNGNGNQSRKNDEEEETFFEYYSGHDITLSPLLASMGLWDGAVPPYASYLAVEFIQRKVSGSGDLYFRVLYNGHDETGKLLKSLCADSIQARYDEAVFKLCAVEGLREFAPRLDPTSNNARVKYGGGGGDNDDKQQENSSWSKLCDG